MMAVINAKTGETKRSDDYKLGYSRGYMAGCKDRPEDVQKLTDKIKELEATSLSLHMENLGLRDKVRVLNERSSKIVSEEDCQSEMFDILWPLITDAEYIRSIAEGFPRMIWRYVDKKTKDAA